MEEFLAGIINGWPIWVILIVGLLAWLVWISFELYLAKPTKKEWWQDREKRKAKKG